MNLQAELDALTRLDELIARLHVCPDVTAALDEVLVATMEITGAGAGDVRLLNAPGDALEIVAQRGCREEFLEHLREVSLDDETALGRAMREGGRSFVEDLRTDPLLEPYGDILAAGCLAVQSTPLISRSGELLGVVSTHHAEAYHPSDRELRELDLYTRLAADFIERTRRQESVAAELAAHERVHEISCRLIPTEDVDALYAELIDAATEIMRSEQGTMQALDDDTGELRLLEAKGMPEQVWEEFARVSPSARSSCGEALRRGERVLVDYLSDARVAGTEEARAHLDAGIRSALSTPLVTRSGRLVGMLTTHWREPQQPPERDLRLLDVLARQAADLVERKVAEDALRERRERLKFAIEAGHLGDWHLDLTTGRARTSLRHDQCFGATEPFEDWSYEKFLSYVYPEDRPEVQRRFETAVEARGDWQFECRVIWPDGSVHWIETHGKLYRDTAGEPRQMLGVVREITERKRTEEQLRRNHDTFFKLIQNSPFGVYIVDSRFRLRQISQGAQKVFENVRPLIGRDFAEVLRSIWEEPFASEAIARFRHTLETGEPYVAVDTTEQRHDVAEVESYDWRIERITLPDGQFGVVCYFYDLSDVKRAEAEIRRRVEEAEESRRILQGIMEYVPEGITVADAPDAAIRMVSRHGAELIGRAAETLLDEPAAVHPETWGIFHPDGETPGKPEELPLTRAVRRGEVVINEEWLLRRPDGSDVTVLCNAGPIRNSDGQIVGGIIAWRDIADVKAAQQALKEADRRKDEFLATLGHELRNPLAAIRTAVRLVQGTGDDPELIAKMAAIIDRQSSQLVRLIDDLLDVSRITRGEIELRRRRRELGSVITQAVEGIRPFSESQNVSLSTVVPPQSIIVEADSARLGQVIGNLLHNACKYTPPGGQVRLVAETEGEEAVVRVQDEGAGIAPEQLPRLFEMFGQIDPRRDRAKGGLGIGLALSKQLVEMHGGSIEARSEGVGRGSEFIIRLPAAPSEPPESAEERSGAEPEKTLEDGGRSPLRAPEPRRILAVDDNRDALQALTALLRWTGHEVQTAVDGEEALHAAEKHRPEVVLLDIGLPGMDGYEVARRIRERPWGKDVTIIAMTGWGHEEDKQRAVEAGFDMHLTKPADVDVIERAVLEAAPES